MSSQPLSNRTESDILEEIKQAEGRAATIRAAIDVHEDALKRLRHDLGELIRDEHWGGLPPGKIPALLRELEIIRNINKRTTLKKIK